jgi:hypothetical protein
LSNGLDTTRDALCLQIASARLSGPYNLLEFRGAGNSEGDESFRENLSRVATWSNEMLSPYPSPQDRALGSTYDADLREKLPIFLTMVSEHPDERPIATVLGRLFGTGSCCRRDPEPFEIETEG